MKLRRVELPETSPVNMNFLESLEAATRPDVGRRPWMDKLVFELVTEETLDRVIDECIAAGRYSFDLETTGLDNRVFNGRTKDSIVGYCLSPDGQRGYYIPVLHRKGEEHNLSVSRVEVAIRRLEASDAVAIFHHGKFDQEFLQARNLGEWDDPRKFEDTEILAYLWNTRANQFGLKFLTKTLLGIAPIELKELFPGDHKGPKDFSELDPSWEPCVWYAASDAIFTYRLYDVLFPKVATPDGDRGRGQEVVYSLEKMCVPAVRWMERCRVFIAQDKVAELMQLGQEEFVDCLREIYDFCNEALKRNIEPGWFRLLREKFVPDDPDYNLNQQLQDCRLEAKRKFLDDLDGKGHYYKTDKGWPERYDVLSRPQLGPLFQELEIPDLRTTKKSEQIQTTQAEIDRLEGRYGHKYPFLPKIKRLGELQKALSAYLISLRNDVGPDGTLRIDYKQLGTDTGRFKTPSSENPATDGGTKYPMHGTPATYDTSRPQCLLRVRECVKARGGKVLVAIDFGGVELRIATILSGEPRWLREFFRCSTCGQEFDSGDGKSTPAAPPAYCPNCGDDRIGDLHTLTGITFFGESKVGTKGWKQLRNRAKSANFSLAYGGGPSAIVRTIKCDEQEAARHHLTFNRTFSTLKAWWDSVKAFGRKHGYVRTDFGRHYPIPDIRLPTNARGVRAQLEEEYRTKVAAGKEASRPNDAAVQQRMEMNRKFRAKAERNATNGPIQGLSADITKLAMALIYKECKKREWLEKVYMTITIHDELVFEIDLDILAEAIEVFQEIMTRNSTILKRKWTVPLTTDCEIGYDWTVPYDIKDFRHRRVRRDGVQVNEKGEPTRKTWPEEFVKIFGPVYGFADDPTTEAANEAANVAPSPLAVVPTETPPETPPEAPQKALEQAPSEESQEKPHETPPEAPQEPLKPFGMADGKDSREPVETAPGPAQAPSKAVGVALPSGPAGQAYEYRLRVLGVGVAERLAHVIVLCQGRGSHVLRLMGPGGENALWPGAKILVNPLEFETAANMYGI